MEEVRDLSRFYILPPTYLITPGIGFIIANVPGAMLGAFAGNRLGSIRDAKGKSVASVFNELGGSQKVCRLLVLCLPLILTARVSLG